MGEARSNIPTEVIRNIQDLRDKFKHGDHIIKILESQLETAKQNISLLQGQIRLANETIENLKQHFSEADLTLSYLTDNSKLFSDRKGEHFKYSAKDDDCYVHGNTYGQRGDELDSQRKAVNLERRSPKQLQSMSHPNEISGHLPESESSERSKSPMSQGKLGYVHERSKSPYAQQLRQVLDALQDEDSRRMNISVGHENSRELTNAPQAQMCMCSECVSSGSAHRQYNDVSSRPPPCSCEYSGTEVHYQDECSKHTAKMLPSSADENALKLHVTRSGEVTQRESTPVSHNMSSISQASQHLDYPPHCTGPCCTSLDLSKGYKIVEATPGVAHYISPRSPRHRHHHEIRHDSNGHVAGHCDDKCRCHAFVNYAPFGYQVVESAPGIPQTIQPISPIIGSKRSKRYHPTAPGDEPPHLKYTKVKRIDGSKVAAQKTIQDFSKRRFHPYNPRWDLDLLIVPPPIPASDLFSALNSQQDAKYVIGTEGNEHDVEKRIKTEDPPIVTDGLESGIVKSKVINAGGTVIVLTESDTIDLSRSVFTHASQNVTMSGIAADQYESVGEQSVTSDEMHRNASCFSVTTSAAISNEKRTGLDTIGHVNEPAIADRAESQANTTPSAIIRTADLQVSGFEQSQCDNLPEPISQVAFSRNVIPNAMNSTNFKIPDANTSVITTASIKKEKNNNSFSTNAISTMMQQQRQSDQQDTYKDLQSNLTARYEKVLFQRNQDFSKLTNDDDFKMQNRVKEKVH